MPKQKTSDYSIATDIEVVGVIDELLTMFMERDNSIEQAGKLLSMAQVALSRIEGEPGPKYADDPESVSGYLLIRQMVRKGIFDTVSARAFAGLVRELAEFSKGSGQKRVSELRMVV